MPGYETIALRDFSGGWNIRDAPSEVGFNESPDCKNITLDERGGAVKRLGYSKYNAVQLNTSTFQNLFYWQTQQLMVGQQGASLYTTTGNGTWSALVKTFSSSALVGMADFQGQLVVVHPVDGVWVSTDGVTFTQTTGGTNNMEAVRGNVLAVWQNKCWVGGDPNNKPRMWASNAGDPKKWTIATDWIDIREKDDALVTAAGAGNGMDISGRPGLLIFKKESTYRINSSNASTGFTYTTLDRDYGASGPLAVASTQQRVAAISEKGIIVTDGVNPPVLASAKISPLFRPEQLYFTNSSLFCAGAKGERIFFSVGRIVNGVNPSANNLVLEYSPQQGWIVPHSFGVSCFTTWAKQNRILYGGAPSSGYAYTLFTGGSDDGTAITAYYQSRWIELNHAGQARLQKMQVSGRGTFNLYIRKDYSTALGDLFPVSIVGTGGTWGVGNWGTMLYGATPLEDYQAFFPLEVCRSVAFYFTESSSTSTVTPKLLGDGASTETGSFACYGIEVDVTPLGRS